VAALVLAAAPAPAGLAGGGQHRGSCRARAHGFRLCASGR
jgi:hypothetical protein